MERIAVIGLGYVGLPVAVAFAREYKEVLGFDINQTRIDALKGGYDRTGEVEDEALKASTLQFTSNVQELVGSTFFVVAVPTPIDSFHKPDLSPVRAACRTVAKALTKGAVVVFESTVYPGVTEEVCRPILEEVSGLKAGVDFKVGYSPERINPGDKVHRLETIVKVVAGEDAASLQRIATTYQAILDFPVHQAPTIKVAEAAKVIENTQRDINIALMNELALIFERLDIRTTDVLKAAGTKWNFLPFTPGLVGGHCIGVDPYYLTARAEQVGYHPHVILAGRQVNDEMGRYVAQRVVKGLNQAGIAGTSARVGVLGLTFKENVGDLRNSRVPDIIEELQSFGVTVLCHDPMVTEEEADRELGVPLTSLDKMTDLHAVIVAVSHQDYLKQGPEFVEKMVGSKGVIFDVKSVYKPSDFSQSTRYLSL